MEPSSTLPSLFRAVHLRWKGSRAVRAGTSGLQGRAGGRLLSLGENSWRAPEVSRLEEVNAARTNQAARPCKSACGENPIYA